MEGCEKCEELERMQEIMDSFERQKKGEAPKIVEDRYAKILQFSNQLRDCLRDMANFYKEMAKLYEECKKKDIYQNPEELKELLESFEDYAQMETVNARVLLETVELIKRQIYR